MRILLLVWLVCGIISCRPSSAPAGESGRDVPAQSNLEMASELQTKLLRGIAMIETRTITMDEFEADAGRWKTQYDSLKNLLTPEEKEELRRRYFRLEKEGLNAPVQ